MHFVGETIQQLLQVSADRIKGLSEIAKTTAESFPELVIFFNFL